MLNNYTHDYNNYPPEVSNELPERLNYYVSRHPNSVVLPPPAISTNVAIIDPNAIRLTITDTTKSDAMVERIIVPILAVLVFGGMMTIGFGFPIWLITRIFELVAENGWDKISALFMTISVGFTGYMSIITIRIFRKVFGKKR